MNKDLELYQEEQIQNLKQINKQLSSSAIIPIPSIPEKMKAEIINKISAEITNKIEIDEKPFEDLSGDLRAELEKVTAQIVKAVVDTSKEPISEITVKNIEQAQSKEVSITNFDELKKHITELTKVIINNQPIVNVEKQEIQFPTSANKPIAVRLSDGKSFYNAISSALSGHADFVNQEGRGTAVKLTNDGRVPVELDVSPTIDIGDVQIKNASGTVINPSTLEKQQEAIDLMKCIVTGDASSTTPLSSGQTYTGNWINFLPWNAAIITVVTNANSTLYIEYSQDGTNVVTNLTRQESISSTKSGAYVAGRRANYFRVRLTANANQSSLNLQTILSARPVQMDAQPITDELKDTFIAETVRSVITGKTTAGGGGYVNVKVTPSGALATETTIEGIDPLAKYKIADTDDASSTKYYGFTDVDGNWYILRESSNAFRYSTGTTNYATNWNNRASLTYDYLFNVTVN